MWLYCQEVGFLVQIGHTEPQVAPGDAIMAGQVIGNLFPDPTIGSYFHVHTGLRIPLSQSSPGAGDLAEGLWVDIFNPSVQLGGKALPYGCWLPDKLPAQVRGLVEQGTFAPAYDVPSYLIRIYEPVPMPTGPTPEVTPLPTAEPYEGDPPDCAPPANCPLCVVPEPLTAGVVQEVTLIVSDPSYVPLHPQGELVFFVRPYGSEPRDVLDGPAPDLNQFVPDERAKTGLYQDGVAYVGLPLQLRPWGDVWAAKFMVMPRSGMEFSALNFLFTDGCVIAPTIVEE
jgi:hypothetical protein